MAEPPTIVDLKLSFLRSQIQALSQPLSLPPNYQPASEDHALSEKAIDAALLKLNETIKKHSKLVYSSQAQRHVAEQIDKLYWQAGDRDVSTGDGLERGADLSKATASKCLPCIVNDYSSPLGIDKNIERLPDTWDDGEEDDERREKYQELAGRLKDLDEQRRQMREKVAGYKMLKEMLEPFEKATETVQENLVGRNGELEKELEKMRLLVARVRGRVEGLPENGNPDDEMDVDLPYE
jgi:hypothetical protein